MYFWKPRKFTLPIKIQDYRVFYFLHITSVYVHSSTKLILIFKDTKEWKDKGYPAYFITH